MASCNQISAAGLTATEEKQLVSALFYDYTGYPN
ncbi:unnamed protein product, partial [marine sediment metagenome]